MEHEQKDISITWCTYTVRIDVLLLMNRVAMYGNYLMFWRTCVLTVASEEYVSLSFMFLCATIFNER